MKQTLFHNLFKQRGLLLVAFLVALFAFIQPGMAEAFSLGFDPGDTLKDETQLGNNDPAYIVFTIVNTGLIFLGMITVIVIVVAGFMFLFAAGSEEKIKKAKDLLKGAVIGLVIVMASYGLAQYIFTAIQLAATG